MTTTTSPKESSFDDQAHLDSSIPLDSDIEDKVLPLPPPLPILKLEKSKFKETRFPLQPTQAGGPNKIQNPTSLHISEESDDTG